MNVSENLVKWYNINKRMLPWRESGNPYHVWISEIILQQTRVQQGMNYYYKFIDRFPTVFILAESSVDQVLKIWQGLGYYSRARNLHKTAIIIVKEYGGIFPKDYHLLLRFPGIGEYTAGAIVSLAFNQPFPAIDGNVYRVLSRYFGVESPIDSAKARKEYYQLALKILDNRNPGSHNQAMIELGALLCLPRNPMCSECPINASCYAFMQRKVSEFPKKKKPITILHRYFNYLMIRKGETFYIKQRDENDIWALLYDLPLIETKKPLKIPGELEKNDDWGKIFSGINYTITKISEQILHQLSHQIIHARFIEIEVAEEIKHDAAFEIKKDQLERYPFSRLIEIYFEGI